MPTAAATLPAGPPSPPRALTPNVQRKSLMDSRVRFWWAAAFIMFVAVIYFLVSHLMAWNQELYVVRHGVPVTATITAMGQGELRGTVSPDNPVELKFTYKDQAYAVDGWLEGRTESISLKQDVSIRIDPDNPQNWTYLTDSPPLGRVILEPGMMALFAAGGLAVSILLRSQILRTWKTGVAEQYVVETVGGPTALAPSSRAVRFRSLSGRDQRLVCIPIPQRLANPKPGDVFWLIHPPGKPSAALAAIVYQD